ncbi:MAG TPA: fibronectin type III domain-containing protein [Acidimicrobiales bacterium]|nr:fibronectin type III domain-containing protein [Acidimicrobiales bacterium]
MAKPPKPMVAVAIGGLGGTATVKWTPGMGGGAPTAYSVMAHEQNFGFTSLVTACASCRSAVLTGLINGRTYLFSVYAVNASGASAAATSTAVLPSSAPTIPQDVRVDGRANSLRVAWVPPVNEGAPLTGYRVSALDASGASVATVTACAACTSAIVGGLANGASYRASVVALNAIGSSPPATSAAGTPTAVPATVASVQAVPAPGGLTVSWSPDSAGATAPDRFLVQATAYDSFSQWYACATCTSLTMAPLPQGRTYDVKVFAHNSAGYGPGRSAGVVSGSGSCVGLSLCADVDTGTTTGPAVGRAQGLLLGYNASTNSTLLNGLHVNQWRVSLGSSAHLKAETMPGVSITGSLSDAWRSSATSGGKLQAPWANWPRYVSFVKQLVQQMKNQGRRVDYWDIQNEPLPTEFSAGPVPTAELWYEQYRVAYEAIKSVDPGAKIVGPSMTQMLWVGDANAPDAVDVPTFMNYADAHNLRFDAYSWHELGIGQAGYYDSPQRIVDDVQAFRTEVARHPNLGTPKVFINEVQPPNGFLVPGQVGGVLAALELSNVDQANSTCHQYATGPTIGMCDTGTLDGMLLDDQTTPRGIYWVRQQYATMTGDRLATLSSSPSLSVFATRPADGVYKVMVSRHASCVKAVNVYCNQTTTATPAAAPVTLKLRTGTDRSAVVDVRMVPVGVGAQPALNDVLDATTSTAGGLTSVTLPSVKDGDVYLLTVTVS